MFKKIVALVFVALLIVPSFAALKALETAKEENIVKIGENVYVPEGSEVSSAVSVGGSVTIAGKVREDVVSIGGSVSLSKSAEIGGNAVAIGGKVEKEAGATVKGEITEVKFPAVMMAKGLGWGIAIFSVLSFIAFLVLAAILVSLFTKQLGLTSYYMEKFPGQALLWGFAGMILIVPLLLLMAVSVIGIPFIPLFLIIVASAYVFGYIGAAHLMGKKFLKLIRIYNEPMMFESMIGLILLCVIGFLPVFGWIVKLVLGLMGFGSVLVTRFGTQKQ